MKNITHRSYHPIPLNLSLLLGTIYGESSYQGFKDFGSISQFKKEAKKIIQTINRAAQANIKISDEYLLPEIGKMCNDFTQRIMSAKKVDEVCAFLIDFLVRNNFLMLGCIPNNFNIRRKKDNRHLWELSQFRSIQFVQTENQKQALEFEINRVS